MTDINQNMRFVSQFILAALMAAALFAGIAHFAGSLMEWIDDMPLVTKSSGPLDTPTPQNISLSVDVPPSAIDNTSNFDQAAYSLECAQQYHEYLQTLDDLPNITAAADMPEFECASNQEEPTKTLSHNQSASNSSETNIDHDIDSLLAEKNQPNESTWRIMLIFVLMYLFLFTQSLVFINRRTSGELSGLDQFIQRKTEKLTDWSINAPPLIGLIGTLIPLGYVVANAQQNGHMAGLETAFLNNFVTALDTTIMGAMVYVVNYFIAVFIDDASGCDTAG